MRLEEVGRTVVPSSELAGAGRFVAAPKVPAEGASPAAAPLELVGVGRSSAAPEVPLDGVASLPRPKSQSGQVDLPPCPRCRWRGVAPPPCPRMQGRQAPLLGIRGRAQNGPALMRWSKDLEVRPPNVSSARYADVSH